MGFWYMLLFLIGIALFVFGITRKSISNEVKIVVLSIILGIFFIFGALFLLLPGSSELLSTLLGLQN